MIKNRKHGLRNSFGQAACKISIKNNFSALRILRSALMPSLAHRPGRFRDDLQQVPVGIVEINAPAFLTNADVTNNVEARRVHWDDERRGACMAGRPGR